MAIRGTPILDTDELETKSSLTGALVGLALAAAVVTGFGAWQAHGQADGRRLTEGAPVAVGAVATSVSTDVTTPWYLRSGGREWYVVASRRQAEELSDMLRRRNDGLRSTGKPVPTDEVVVVDSAAAEEWLTAMRELILGPLGIVIMDLRGILTGGGAQAGDGCGTVVGPVGDVFITPVGC